MNKTEEFLTWLEHEIQTHSWSYRELGRRANLSPTIVSKVMTQASLPGFQFCINVAQALNVPPELVLRKAGLLPSLPEPQAKTEELLYHFRALSPDDRHRLIAIARTLSGK